MKPSNIKTVALILGIAAAIYLGTVLLHSPPPGTGPHTDSHVSDALFQKAAGVGIAGSANKVNATAHWSAKHRQTKGRSLRLKLHIASGWHVNANPASLAFLIPTQVTAFVNGQPVDIKVRYPPGADSGIHLNGRAIQVYNDNAEINVSLKPKGVLLMQEAGRLDLKIRVQACSDKGICLAPSTLDLTTSPG